MRILTRLMRWIFRRRQRRLRRLFRRRPDYLPNPATDDRSSLQAFRRIVNRR
jgi:hypothetical protein